MVSPLAIRRRAAKAAIAAHSPDLRETLGAQRDRLAQVASAGKLATLQKLYERAQSDLERKLRAAVGAGRGDTFTALQQRSMLGQVRQGQVQIAKMMAGHAAELSEIAQVEALRGLEQDIARLELMFTGASVVVPTAEAGVFAGVIAGRRQSLLSQHQKSMARWGQSTVEQIQDEMALSLATGETTSAAIDRVARVANANFWQAERIVRTETAWAYNATLADGINKAADDLGDLYQRWVEFCSDEGVPRDARVGVDSIAMHGQIAHPGGTFTMPAVAPHPDAKGNVAVPVGLVGQLWAFPPNRPNDRAVLQPWRPDWGIPGWVYSGGARAKFSADLLPRRERRPYQLEEARAPRAKREKEEPEPTRPPVEMTAAVVMAEKVGDARGSNVGGFYRGTDGVTRYVKLYEDRRQAEVEHLAGSVYRDLGIPAPVTHVFAQPGGMEGKFAFASDVLPSFQTVQEAGLTVDRAKEIADGFVADCLLGNWDVVGLANDNVGVSGGKVHRIDNGSALYYRARGGLKPAAALHTVAEFDTFFDETLAPSYAQVLKKAGYEQPEDMRQSLRAQMAKLRELRDRNGGWATYVDRALPKADPIERAKMADLLEARTSILGDYCDASVFRASSKAGKKLDRIAGRGYEVDEHNEAAQRAVPSHMRRAHADVLDWVNGWTSGGRMNREHLLAYKVLDGDAGRLGTGDRAAPNPQDVAALRRAFSTVQSPEMRQLRWKAWMQSAGVSGEAPTHIEVYRGSVGSGGGFSWAESMASAWADPAISEVEVPVDAVASWSFNREAAKGFGEGGDGVVMKWRVPLSNTVADIISDDGQFSRSYAHEREVIAGPLKGGAQGRLSLPKREQTVLFAGKEYSYAEREDLFAALHRVKGGPVVPGKGFPKPAVAAPIAVPPAPVSTWMFKTAGGDKVYKHQLTGFLQAIASNFDAKGATAALEAAWPDLLKSPGYAKQLVAESGILFKGGVAEAAFVTKGGEPVTMQMVSDYLQAVASDQTETEATRSLLAYWPEAAQVPGGAKKLVKQSNLVFAAPAGGDILKGEVHNLLHTFLDGGMNSPVEAVDAVMEKFSVSEAKAEAYVKNYVHPVSGEVFASGVPTEAVLPSVAPKKWMHVTTGINLGEADLIQHVLSFAEDPTSFAAAFGPVSTNWKHNADAAVEFLMKYFQMSGTDATLMIHGNADVVKAMKNVAFLAADGPDIPF